MSKSTGCRNEPSTSENDTMTMRMRFLFAALDQTKLFQRSQAGQGLAGVFRPCGCKQRLQIIRKHIAGAHHAIHGSGIGTGGQAGQPLVMDRTCS